MILSDLNYTNHETLIDSFIKYYISEFGERKFRNILHKIETSNKIEKLFNELRRTNEYPDPVTTFSYINAIPFFILSRGQTQTVGALLILKKWQDEINSKKRILNDYDVMRLTVDMIKEMAATFY